MTKKIETAILGGGCFWCLEAAFNLIDGIVAVESGYSGGSVASPTYEQVCSDNTGHAEVVKVYFDSDKIKYKDVLDIFWAIHDPTTINRQGNDVGEQYRSVIFYTDLNQRTLAEESKKQVAKLWPGNVVTEIKPLEKFYKAEDYHQSYYERNPSQAYCQIIINPKLKHLREKFQARLKTK